MMAKTEQDNIELGVLAEGVEGVASWSVLSARLRDFEAGLEENSASPNQAEIDDLVAFVEEAASSPDRVIRVFSDPDFVTYFTMMVPTRRVAANGAIIEDPHAKTFVIGVPYSHLSGLAPREFLLGAIFHEKGHAEWTSFAGIEGVEDIIRAEGYDPEIYMMLENRIEDTRMERLVGGRNFVAERKILFEKNSRWVIPKMVSLLKDCSPVEQFLMLVKLERLWELHRAEWPEIGVDPDDKPWRAMAFNEDTRRLFDQVAETLARISGDTVKPAMKVRAKVEALIMTVVWPALRELIDKYPQEKKEPEDEGQEEEVEQNQGRQGGPAGGDEGSGSDGSEDTEAGEGGQTGEDGAKVGDALSDDVDTDQDGSGGRENQQGADQGGDEKLKRPAMTGNMPEEDEHFDPKDPSKWSDDLKKNLQKLQDLHEKRLAQQSAENIANTTVEQERQEEHERLKHALEAKSDHFKMPGNRVKYRQYLRELAPVILRVKRTFERYLPAVADPEFVYGRRGKSFSTQQFVRRYGGGYETPMRYKVDAERKGLVLQLQIDISGSMAEHERIQNAVKACLAVCEAAKGTNTHIEILASDHSNVGESDDYLIKGFNEVYGGEIAERLVKLLGACDGENRDAEAIRVAIPRVLKQMKRSRADYDRVAGLSIFISDSTTKSKETKQAALWARSQIPFEGMAISNEKEIASLVRYHFGEKAVVPPSVELFPQALESILEQHIRHLRSHHHD